MADTTPYGNVPYADPGYQPDEKKRYPIDCEHVEAAWSYINQEDNQRPYTAEQLSAIKGRIRAAMAKCGHKVSDSGRSTVDALERRDNPGVVELRADPGKIGGYGAVFNKQSKSLGGFVEQVHDRAFEHNRGRDWPGVMSRFNHDPNMLLGTTAAGTLWLRTDEVGLDYEVQPPRSRGDVMESVQRRDIRHSSFTFRALEQEWGVNDQGTPMRTLLRVQLFEVGPVASPAYPDTTAALRSLAEHFDVDIAEIESRAAKEELRGLFVRTDVEGQAPKKTVSFGPAVKMALLARRKDPWQR